MTKILNNAIIAKCGECERYCFPTHIEGIWSDTCLHRDFPRPIKPVNPDSIDLSCPLAECLIIPKDKIGFHSINGKLSSISIGINGENKDGNIDYIVIVKRGGHK